MMAVGDALGPGGDVAGAQQRLALVLDQHRLAGEHDQQLVLASCQCRWLDQAPGSSVDMADAESVRPAAGASRR